MQATEQQKLPKWNLPFTRQRWRRFALHVIVSVAFALICPVLFLLFERRYEFAVFWGYSSCAVLWITFGLLSPIGLDIDVARAKVFRHYTPIQKARRFFTRFMAIVDESLAWPVSVTIPVFAARSRRGREIIDSRNVALQSGFAASLEHLNEYAASFLMLCQTLVWWSVVSHFGVTSPWSVRLFAIPMLAITVRQIAALPVRGGLIGSFRREPGNPLAKFVTIVACDFLTMCVSLSFLAERVQSQRIDFGTVVATGVQIFGLSGLPGRIAALGLNGTFDAARHITPAHGLFLFASIISYGVLGRALIGFNLKSFEREDEDRYVVVDVLVRQREYKKALEMLKDATWNAKTQGLRVAPLLALGRLERAQACAEDFLKHDTSINNDITIEGVYFYLFKESKLIGSGETYHLVWKGAVDNHCSISFLAFTLDSYSRDEKFNLLLKDDPSTRTPAVKAAYHVALLMQGKYLKDKTFTWPDDLSMTKAEDVALDEIARVIDRIWRTEKHEERLDIVSRWISETEQLPEKLHAAMESGDLARLCVASLLKRIAANIHTVGSDSTELWLETQIRRLVAPMEESEESAFVVRFAGLKNP